METRTVQVDRFQIPSIFFDDPVYIQAVYVMLQNIPTALYSLYIHINNSVPQDGLESPKHVEHPKIKTSCNNMCILLVHSHIAPSILQLGARRTRVVSFRLRPLRPEDNSLRSLWIGGWVVTRACLRGWKRENFSYSYWESKSESSILCPYIAYLPWRCTGPYNQQDPREFINFRCLDAH